MQIILMEMMTKITLWTWALRKMFWLIRRKILMRVLMSRTMTLMRNKRTGMGMRQLIKEKGER